MSETRYVVTKDIRSATEGHEEEILDALGIDWRRGHPHIDCPYPEHGGANDWRWDRKKLRAYCTCAEKGDNILEVVRRCDGVEFEDAKVRAAEMIGRSDLIKVKGGTKGQKQDVFSLLHPPSTNEDRDVCRAYLAHRLMVAAAAVVLPSTATAGWKALGYFEAPPRGSKNPVHVGDFACCVFGQIDPDGKTHAHRIYVQPAGAGKAELGKTDAGEFRDPKKSAKLAEGETMAGKAVVFGKAGEAEHLILAEGIETAAAIAYVFKDEIDSGSTAVVAGVSAVGVETFKLYPTTKRITVAADRDEKPAVGKVHASRRGERAAREFGIRNHERVSVAITLPGSTDTKTDWLDILVTTGVEGVRFGIEAAVRYQPTQAELDERVERAGRDATVQKVIDEYPLPVMTFMPLEYRWCGNGVWLHKTVKRGKGEDAYVEQVPICTPFGIPARLRMDGQEKSYGLRLVLQDMGGDRRNLDVDRGDFAKVGGAEARTHLFANGLRVQEDGEKIAVELLKAAGPSREIIIVRRAGWHKFDGQTDPFFVCPDGTIIGAESGQWIELAQNATISPDTARSGTIEAWKLAVTTACTVTGCEHWIIGVIAAFAGTIISLTGIDTCGINLSGLTSSGKTTAQRLGVSAWSRPATAKDSLFQSARATANALESTAARANGTILVLDELGHIPGKEVGKLIYMIASSVGKGRMTSSATARESYTWSTFAFLSAETSLEEKIKADGETLKGGQAVRFPDIDVTGVNGQVSPETLGKINEIRRNFGHAGPAFVTAMINRGDHRTGIDIQTNINTVSKRLAMQGMDGKEPEAALSRAAVPFAIMYIAGKLAQTYGILPDSVDVSGAVRWAWAKFKGSSEAIALDPQAQAVGNLRRFIAERWNTSIQNLESTDRPVKDAVGWYNDDAVYLPDSRICEAAGGALKELQIAAVLNQGGYIAKRKSDRHNCVGYVPRVGPIKAYALSRKHFGRSSIEPAELHVVGGRG